MTKMIVAGYVHFWSKILYNLHNREIILRVIIPFGKTRRAISVVSINIVRNFNNISNIFN